MGRCNESRLMPDARYASRRSRVTVPGLHSIVHSASSAIAYELQSFEMIVAMSAGESNDGVPPPKNTDVAISLVERRSISCTSVRTNA